MDDIDPALPDKTDVGDVLAVLERALVQLDSMGLHIAAAHLDASIQQVRLDHARHRSLP